MIMRKVGEILLAVAALVYGPFIPWWFVWYVAAPKGFDPSSFWVYICMWPTLILLIFLGTSLYEIFKEKNRGLGKFAMAAGSLVLLIPSVIYVVNDISLARERYDTREQTFTLWENSILASCPSINEDSSPSDGSVKPKGRIWMVINGRFATSDRDELLLLTPEERSNTVRAIALIDESYRETGMHYAEDNFLYKTGTGILAVQYSWSVSICDLDARRFIAKKAFVGPEPPEKISSRAITEDVFGIRPYVEYETWIKTLTDR
jgi:hypothetical protein